MRLADLAKKAARLPDIEFDWPGAEHWSDEVFDRQVTTLPETIKYVEALRERMASYSYALSGLTDAYRKMRDIMLEAEVKGAMTPAFEAMRTALEQSASVIDCYLDHLRKDEWASENEKRVMSAVRAALALAKESEGQ